MQGRGARSQNGKYPQEMLEGLHIFHLAWEHLAIPQEETQDVAGGKYVWATLLAVGPESTA